MKSKIALFSLALIATGAHAAPLSQDQVSGIVDNLGKAFLAKSGSMSGVQGLRDVRDASSALISKAEACDEKWLRVIQQVVDRGLDSRRSIPMRYKAANRVNLISDEILTARCTRTTLLFEEATLRNQGNAASYRATAAVYKQVALIYQGKKDTEEYWLLEAEKADFEKQRDEFWKQADAYSPRHKKAALEVASARLAIYYVGGVRGRADYDALKEDLEGDASRGLLADDCDAYWISRVLLGVEQGFGF